MGNMKIFFININYFLSIFSVFWYAKKLMTSVYSKWCQHPEPTLNRLFNNCLKLYWYWINFSWNMKRLGVEGGVVGWVVCLVNLRHKIIFKKPSLVTVLGLRDFLETKKYYSGGILCNRDVMFCQRILSTYFLILA